MFLFAPLSIGLAAIYFELDNDDIHLPGLLVNVILLLILVGIMAGLIAKKKLLLPSLLEKKFLLFGLLSNIVIYFYVYQNSLNIEELINVYIVTILILLLYFTIISKKPIIYELWIFGIWFFILDTIHYQFIYTNNYDAAGIDVNFFQHILYLTIPLLTLGLFVYNMYKYKVMDAFTKIAVAIVLMMSIIFLNSIGMENKFILTLNLVLPFVILADFITMLIYKRFNILKLPFYMRLTVLMVLMIYYAEEGLFQLVTYSHEGLYEMVAIIYVALISTLIVYLTPRKSEDELLFEEVEVIDTDSSETLLKIDLNALTVTTLKALAKAKGIEGYTKLEKEEIINLLK
jgi:hypothetical protein